MSVKDLLLGKLGYQRRISKHKFLNPLDAKSHFLAGIDGAEIFDVGAHHGETALEYRKRFPGATIRCFEPYIESYQVLKDRFLLDPSFHCYQMALSDANETVPFHINMGTETNSLLPGDIDSLRWIPLGMMKCMDTCEVLAKTLDSFCLEEKIHRINLLKLDTQGCELKVLTGAAQALQNGIIDVIFAEMLFVPLYEGQAYFHDVCSFLSKYDYRLFDLFNHRYAENGQLKWADAIFLPS